MRGRKEEGGERGVENQGGEKKSEGQEWSRRVLCKTW